MNDIAGGRQSDRAPTSQEVAISLLTSARALEDRIEGTLGALGLSLAKLNVLSRMAEADKPLALSEIAARLNCVRSNVTQLVDRLEADGLVRREADADDRRSIRAVLTAEGRARQASGASELVRVTAEFSQPLSVGDRTALHQTLRQLK